MIKGKVDFRYCFLSVPSWFKMVDNTFPFCFQASAAVSWFGSIGGSWQEIAEISAMQVLQLLGLKGAVVFVAVRRFISACIKFFSLSLKFWSVLSWKSMCIWYEEIVYSANRSRGFNIIERQIKLYSSYWSNLSSALESHYLWQCYF